MSIALSTLPPIMLTASAVNLFCAIFANWSTLSSATTLSNFLICSSKLSSFLYFVYKPISLFFISASYSFTPLCLTYALFYSDIS